MVLVHYCIVRRDLPLGVLSAMLVHAAGESGALYQDPYDGRFRGAIAVVLEVPDEKGLDKAVIKLLDFNIPHIRVFENSGPYAGQFMAIGLVPGDREKLSPVLSDFQTLKPRCSCSNCLDKPLENP